MSEDGTIAVLGATGQQGAAVVDALLDRGARVRALVRDPDAQKARALADRGVELARADQEDGDSVEAALRGTAVVFLMTTFSGEDGVVGEVRRGTTVAEAAARAGVPRAVYSSVGGAERGTGIPHFESKRRVEERLRQLLPVRFVRPAYFMENFAQALAGDHGDELVLRQPMPGDVPLQMVAVADIGRVAAALLLDADAIEGDAIEIAGDERTLEQVTDLLGAHLGLPARYEALPVDSLPDEDLRAMFRWFVDTPAYEADLAGTRALDPAVLDLPGWLQRR